MFKETELINSKNYHNMNYFTADEAYLDRSAPEANLVSKTLCLSENEHGQLDLVDQQTEHMYPEIEEFSLTLLPN